METSASFLFFPYGFYYWIGVLVVGYQCCSLLLKLVVAFRVWMLDNTAILGSYVNTWAGESIYSFLDASPSVSGMGCCCVPLNYAKLPHGAAGAFSFR